MGQGLNPYPNRKGYVDSEEVSRIAGFIAGLDKDIPLCPLGLYPQFYMTDLPVTSRRHAEECEAAAKEAGLNWEYSPLGERLLIDGLVSYLSEMVRDFEPADAKGFPD